MSLSPPCSTALGRSAPGGTWGAGPTGLCRDQAGPDPSNCTASCLGWGWDAWVGWVEWVAGDESVRGLGYLTSTPAHPILLALQITPFYHHIPSPDTRRLVEPPGHSLAEGLVLGAQFVLRRQHVLEHLLGLVDLGEREVLW